MPSLRCPFSLLCWTNCDRGKRPDAVQSRPSNPARSIMASTLMPEIRQRKPTRRIVRGRRQALLRESWRQLGGTSGRGPGTASRSEAAASLQILAWIIGILLLPFAHQLLKLPIALVGERDPHRGVQIPGFAFGRHALAGDPEGPAAAGARRQVELHGAAQCRHPHLAAEYGLIKRDWHVDTEVVAVAYKVGMRGHVDGDEYVASATRTGQPLSLEADLLALAEPGRNLDVDLLAGRQLHAPGCALGGFGE